MEIVLETEERVDPQCDQQSAAQSDKNWKFELTAESFGALGGFEDGHGQADCDCRAEEEEGQRRRIPERVQLAGHDQVERSKGALVERGEQDAGHDEYRVDLVDPLD